MARTLVRGATLVSMDERVGDHRRADLLVEDDRIAAIAPALALAPADVDEVVDAVGRIAIPGLVDAHLHTWQTALRGVAADWTLLEYFRRMHAGMATVFTPEDIGVATLAGALDQLDRGTTLLGDWCHNNPTPAHSDAAVDALVASGIRAVFFHGTPKPDPRPGEPGFWEIPHPRAEVERLQRRLAGHPRVGVGAAVLGPHYSTMEVARHDLRMARELGVVASMHQGGGAPRTPGGWERLDAEGLLGPRVNVVHGQGLDDTLLARLCALGATFSITPENEMTQGHGHPITGRLRRLGRAPSLGVDLASVLSGDMLSVARIALATQRALDNAAHREATGTIPPTSTIPVREALAWATIEGARALGLDDQVGTLTPGKRADLVLVDARGLGMQPLHDPVAAVVMQAGAAQIESVMVAGRWVKREHRLLADGVPRLIERLRASGERIVAALGR